MSTCNSYYSLRYSTGLHLNDKTHPECLKGSPAGNKVAAVVKSSDAIMFDAFPVSQRQRQGVLLT